MKKEEIKERIEDLESKEKATRKNRKKEPLSRKEKTLEKKVQALEAENAKLKEDVEKIRDQLLRQVAEFDNYKRRSEKEYLVNIEMASRELIEELIPVIDDFERSIQHAEKDNKKSPMLEGVKMIYKNLLNVMKKRGLMEIEAVGKEFNPDEHNALLQMDSDEYDSGYVVDQHAKGYKLRDRVIRHSQVIVAK